MALEQVSGKKNTYLVLLTNLLASHNEILEETCYLILASGEAAFIYSLSRTQRERSSVRHHYSSAAYLILRTLIEFSVALSWTRRLNRMAVFEGNMFVYTG